MVKFTEEEIEALADAILRVSTRRAIATGILIITGGAICLLISLGLLTLPRWLELFNLIPKGTCVDRYHPILTVTDVFDGGKTYDYIFANNPKDPIFDKIKELTGADWRELIEKK